MNKNYYPIFTLDENSKFFIDVSIYSSLNQKKIAEFLIQSDNKINEFLNVFECFVSQMNNDKVTKYMILENHMIVNVDEENSLN